MVTFTPWVALPQLFRPTYQNYLDTLSLSEMHPDIRQTHRWVSALPHEEKNQPFTIES